jgi:hypothetical protein
MLCNGYWWGWTQLQQPSIVTYCNHRTKWNFAGRYSLLQDDVIAKDKEMIVVIETRHSSPETHSPSECEKQSLVLEPSPWCANNLADFVISKMGWIPSLSLLLKTHSKHKWETKCWTNKCWTATPRFFWVQPYVSTGATERFLEFWTWQLYTIVQWSF